MEQYILVKLLVTIEEGGRQKMWATNASGESIDIDITNGSRLLINGRDVEKSIDKAAPCLRLGLFQLSVLIHLSLVVQKGQQRMLSAGCASRCLTGITHAALATVMNNHTGDKDDNPSALRSIAWQADDSPKVAARKQLNYTTKFLN